MCVFHVCACCRLYFSLLRRSIGACVCFQPVGVMCANGFAENADALEALMEEYPGECVLSSSSSSLCVYHGRVYPLVRSARKHSALVFVPLQTCACVRACVGKHYRFREEEKGGYARGFRCITCIRHHVRECVCVLHVSKTRLAWWITMASSGASREPHRLHSPR